MNLFDVEYLPKPDPLFAQMQETIARAGMEMRLKLAAAMGVSIFDTVADLDFTADGQCVVTARLVNAQGIVPVFKERS